MIDEKGLAIRGQREIAIEQADAILELETRFAIAVRQRELLAAYIKERLKVGEHYYSFGDDPGRKPSLKKEGAEIINLPHNLKPKYLILSGPDKPSADNAPYQVTIGCSLWRVGQFEGEGIGSASSYQTTKEGNYQPRQKDPGLCYNATLKMAQKSAYIAATLNSTAASEFFTQDMEDIEGEDKSSPKKAASGQHWCAEHQTLFFKRGKMTIFAHPIGDTGKWCHEKASPKEAGDSKPPTQADTPKILHPASISNGEELPNGIDMAELRQMLTECQWSPADVGVFIKKRYGVTGRDQIQKLSREQAEDFMQAVQERLARKEEGA